MKFIHGYDESFFSGLEKCGLLNRNSGFKVTQHFATPEEEKFNHIAARGGKLHQLICENGFAFYIDRLQGGTFYQKYDFDAKLLDEYAERLGENFLGIQMHEWGAVLNLDWRRIRKQLSDVPQPWTEQQIYEAIKEVSACKWCIHLSCGTAAEYAAKQYSETWQEYLAEMRELFEKRQNENGGFLLPCDSHVQAPKIELEYGARAAMPEVGAQISLMRLQVAMARGCFGSRGKPWGVYYEPWGGIPFSAPHFFDTAQNEWRLDNTIFPFDFTSGGPNGGSSRLLQRRIFFYALLSGAHFISEEWGVSNTFYNWRDYELTPYGEVKKEFIDFAEQLPEGEPYVPFAVVLPREMEAVDINYITRPNSPYLGRDLSGDYQERFSHVRDVLRLIYMQENGPVGNEAHVLTNSRFGDFFDVIYADAGDEIFSRYSCLIDASANGGFVSSSAASGNRVIRSDDCAELAAALEGIMDKEFPCTVLAGAHWLLNRIGDKWMLVIFNNNGVERSIEHGDRILPDNYLEAEIEFRNSPAELEMISGSWNHDSSMKKIGEKSYRCHVTPGGFVLVTFAV